MKKNKKNRQTPDAPARQVMVPLESAQTEEKMSDHSGFEAFQLDLDAVMQQFSGEKDETPAFSAPAEIPAAKAPEEPAAAEAEPSARQIEEAELPQAQETAELQPLAREEPRAIHLPRSVQSPDPRFDTSRFLTLPQFEAPSVLLAPEDTPDTRAQTEKNRPMTLQMPAYKREPAPTPKAWKLTVVEKAAEEAAPQTPQGPVFRLEEYADPAQAEPPSRAMPVLPAAPTSTAPVGDGSPVPPTSATPVGDGSPVPPTRNAPVGAVTGRPSTSSAPVGDGSPVPQTTSAPVGAVIGRPPTRNAPVGAVIGRPSTSSAPVGDGSPVPPTRNASVGVIHESPAQQPTPAPQAPDHATAQTLPAGEDDDALFSAIEAILSRSIFDEPQPKAANPDPKPTPAPTTPRTPAQPPKLAAPAPAPEPPKTIQTLSVEQPKATQQPPRNAPLPEQGTLPEQPTPTSEPAEPKKARPRKKWFGKESAAESRQIAGAADAGGGVLDAPSISGAPVGDGSPVPPTSTAPVGAIHESPAPQPTPVPQTRKPASSEPKPTPNTPEPAPKAPDSATTQTPPAGEDDDALFSAIEAILSRSIFDEPQPKAANPAPKPTPAPTTPRTPTQPPKSAAPAPAPEPPKAIPTPSAERPKATPQPTRNAPLPEQDTLPEQPTPTPEPAEPKKAKTRKKWFGKESAAESRQIAGATDAGGVVLDAPSISGAPVGDGSPVPQTTSAPVGAVIGRPPTSTAPVGDGSPVPPTSSAPVGAIHESPAPQPTPAPQAPDHATAQTPPAGEDDAALYSAIDAILSRSIFDEPATPLSPNPAAPQAQLETVPPKAEPALPETPEPAPPAPPAAPQETSASFFEQEPDADLLFADLFEPDTAQKPAREPAEASPIPPEQPPAVKIPRDTTPEPEPKQNPAISAPAVPEEALRQADAAIPTPAAPEAPPESASDAPRELSALERLLAMATPITLDPSRTTEVPELDELPQIAPLHTESASDLPEPDLLAVVQPKPTATTPAQPHRRPDQPVPAPRPTRQTEPAAQPAQPSTGHSRREERRNAQARSSRDAQPQAQPAPTSPHSAGAAAAAAGFAEAAAIAAAKGKAVASAAFAGGKSTGAGGTAQKAKPRHAAEHTQERHPAPAQQEPRHKAAAAERPQPRPAARPAAPQPTQNETEPAPQQAPGSVRTQTPAQQREPQPTRPQPSEPRPQPAESVAASPQPILVHRAEPERTKRQHKTPPRETLRTPEEAYRKYGKEYGALGSRLVAAVAVTILGLFFTLYAGLGWSFLPSVFSTGLCAYVLLVLMLGTAAICVDVWKTAITRLEERRFGPDMLLLLTAFINTIYTFFAAHAGRVPLCGVVQVLFCFAMWGKYTECVAKFTSMRVLRTVENPIGIVEAPDLMKGHRGILRAEGDVEQFMKRFERWPQLTRAMEIYAPAAAVLSLALGALIGIMAKVDALWVMSLLLCGSLPLAGFIGYSRTFYRLSRRLDESDAVLCGWHGASLFAGKHTILVSDADLFPPGSLTINGFKIFQGNPDRVIGLAAATIHASQSALTPLFDELLEAHNGRHYTVDQFRFYKNGGIGAEVGGEVVLVGSNEFMKLMGVHMDPGVRVQQAAYVSVGGELAGVFAIRYTAPESVHRGLTAICRNRHFKTTLITRCFLGTPGFLKAKFDVPAGNIAYPASKERLRLSETAPHGDEQGAILAEDSFGAFAEAVAGGRQLHATSRAALLLALGAGLISFVLMAILAVFGAYETGSALNLLLYHLLWAVPTVLLTAWAERY